jgi:RNA polymerase sigma factor (sigma-70 family)
MRLDEFSDEYIAKTVTSASRLYVKYNPYYADDARQIGYLALYELRQRLQDHYKGCHKLASRNIYYVVKRAIGRALVQENKHSGNTLIELPADEITGIDYSDRIFLKEKWQLLSNNEKRILRQYYFLGMTQQKIADKRKISRPRVTHIIRKAIEKMGSDK